MSALPDFKEPDVLHATTDEAIDVIASMSGWDADHHGAMWWSARIDDHGYYDDLDGIDKAVISSLIAADTSSRTADLRRRMRSTISREIAEWPISFDGDSHAP